MRSEWGREPQQGRTIWDRNGREESSARLSIPPGWLASGTNSEGGTPPAGHPDASQQAVRNSTRSIVPVYMRRIERYVAERIEQPISLAELSELAGVSERAIQAGFRAYHGCTPLAYLRTQRLERVRRRLLESREDVTTAAQACGFRHLGRFSVAYRQRFGESPSETLKTARVPRR
jgi:transcriptional regulator GlxA family with amidase domain